MKRPASKTTYFEAMRILAIVLVLFNHLPGYTLYQISSGPKQWFYMALTMITRLNVPLFFMVSGALLLKKEEDMVAVLKKRVSRFIAVLILFQGALYCLYKLNAILKNWSYDFRLSKFIFGLFAKNLDGTGGYWYLYSYLGLLFVLPFMQHIARLLKKQEIAVLLGLHFLFSSLLPMANILLEIAGKQGRFSVTSDFSIPFATTKAFFYPLLGYYLDNQIDITRLKRRHLGGLLAAALAGIALSCLCTYYEGVTTGSYTQNYVQMFDYITTIAAFIFIKYLFTVLCPQLSGGGGGASQAICTVGSLTFGIYLLEPFLKLVAYSYYSAFAEPFLPTLIVSIGWIMIHMLVGGALTAGLKKLPGIQKLL